MSRFIKFIPSKEAFWLLYNKRNAFVLLTIIAERARRYNGDPDGLKIGQCKLGDWKGIGFTRQEYRSSLNILIKANHCKIIETNRTRKKSTTGSTTEGTLIELISSTVYNINSENDNHSINHCPTTDQPLTQPRTRKRKKDKNIKEDHPSIPSFEDDDFSSKVEIIPGIFINQEDLDACLKLKGDIEKVKHAVEFIQSNPKREHVITDWPNALKFWKIPDKTKVRIEENIALAARLCLQFEYFEQGNGWRCREYHDRVKDQHGLLFECQNPHQDAIFIGYSDGEFEEKSRQTIKDKIVCM